MRSVSRKGFLLPNRRNCEEGIILKRTLAILFVLILTLSFVVGGLTAGAEGKLVTAWLGDWWANEVERLERDFAAQNEGYTLKIELMPVNNYVENASTAILGGNSPDVLALDTLMIPTVASRDMLLQLDDFMSKHGITKDLFGEATYNAGVRDGKTFAIPYRSATTALFYNKTLFDAAGAPYPTDRMGYADFLETCKKLTNAEKGVYGFGIAASKSDAANVMTSFCPFLWETGGDFLSADLSKCTLDTPESIQGITNWVELYTTAKVVPEGCINYAITKDLFPLAMEQQIAMIPMNDSNIVKIDNFAKEKNFEWDVALLPGSCRAGGWSFSIPISAKNVEGAEAFIAWFIKPEILSQEQVVMPGVMEARKGGKWGDAIYDKLYEAELYAKNCPPSPQWTEIQNIVTQELQKALLGEITPEQAAKNMAEQVNAIL